MRSASHGTRYKIRVKLERCFIGDSDSVPDF